MNEALDTIKSIKAFLAYENDPQAWSVLNEADDILMSFFEKYGHIFNRSTVSRAHEVVVNELWSQHHHSSDVYSALAQAEELLNGLYMVVNSVEKWRK